MTTAIALAEKGLVPDALLRVGIRRLVRQRLAEQAAAAAAVGATVPDSWLEAMREAPIALHTESANEQHYEVPAEFFELVLGRHMKYSSGYWPEGVSDLCAAEEAMLRLSCERAGLRDGQQVLELGCGWGSLSLWMAAQYPRSEILAVSNSESQRAFILGQAGDRGLDNLAVQTADMNRFSTSRSFDRVVSIEMFEHMRNWEELLGRIARWLVPGGRVFLHVFSHREHAYPFETEGADNWMGRFFFTGGMMPSDDLVARLRTGFEVEGHHFMDGTHYSRTAEAWLQKLDAGRAAALAVLERTYGRGEAGVWLRRWRLFFLACAELFGYRQGGEWGVSHYRLRLAEDA